MSEFDDICLICLRQIREGQKFFCTVTGCQWNESRGRWGGAEHSDWHSVDCVHDTCLNKKGGAACA